MRFQIRDANAGLAFYEAETAEEALGAFLRDMVHGMTKVLEGAVIHTANGKPADLTFAGERFYAVPACGGTGIPAAGQPND